MSKWPDQWSLIHFCQMCVSAGSFRPFLENCESIYLLRFNITWNITISGHDQTVVYSFALPYHFPEVGISSLHLRFQCHLQQEDCSKCKQSSVETNNYFGTNRISNIIHLMKIWRIEYRILFVHQENIRILFEYLKIFEYSNIFK